MKKKQNKKPNIFFWFMGLMGRRLPVYLFAILVSTLGFSIHGVARAWLIKNVMEAVQTRNTEGLALTLFWNGVVFVAALFVWRFGIIRYNIEAKKGIAGVEKKVFAKVLRLPMSYYEKHHSGDFMSRLLFDTERAGDIYGSRFRRLADAILSTVIYMIPMLYLSWQLTLCLCAVSGAALLTNSLFVKPLKRLGRQLSEKNSRMTENITNLLAGMETSKIFPTGDRLLRGYHSANSACYDLQCKTNYRQAALEGLNGLFDLLSSLAFLGVGIWFLSEGIVDLGELTAIYALYGGFRYTVLEIGKYIPQMVNNVANAERLYDFLAQEEEPERYPDERPEQSAAEDFTAYILTAADISFSYQENSYQENSGQEDSSREDSARESAEQEGRQIIKQFSFAVKKGEFVALTGESGCGKSTFAKILLGFYRPAAGRLSLEGRAYQDMTLRQIRSKIGYVPQEPYLFQTTIARNIAYGRSDIAPEQVPMEDIIAAAKAANAHDFIMKLPKGYDTVPGERGNTLSGGERQRVAIARAVLKNAPILLLDEATSALDNESERLVNEAIERLCENRTTIMIAHRASTIDRADRVVNMPGSLIDS